MPEVSPPSPAADASIPPKPDPQQFTAEQYATAETWARDAMLTGIGESTAWRAGGHDPEDVMQDIFVALRRVSNPELIERPHAWIKAVLEIKELTSIRRVSVPYLLVSNF